MQPKATIDHRRATHARRRRRRDRIHPHSPPPGARPGRRRPPDLFGDGRDTRTVRSDSRDLRGADYCRICSGAGYGRRIGTSHGRPAVMIPRAFREGLLKRLLQPLLALAVGLMIGLAATWTAGENPMHVLRILVKSAFGSRYDLGMTLFYSTPLIFTGLSVAVAFQAGLFNIGGEGQLTVGALAAATVGAIWPGLPWPWAPILAASAAALAGIAWGGIPGWLRARRGSHEVINTIMLNFVAAGLTSYVAL